MVARSFKNKGLIAFLLFLVLIIGFLAYQNARDFSQLKNAFDIEKKELEQELDDVIREYQSTITENHSYSDEIQEQLQKVVLLKDTIKKLHSSNYKLLRFYRKRISNLEKENKKLLTKLDSLNYVNKNLFTENDSVKSILSEAEELNSKLYQNNKLLGQKIAFAEILKIAKIDFSAMKKRSNGTLTTTYRSWKTGAFKIQFDLLENKIIDKGTKQIHIQIINPKNEVINVKGRVKLKNGKRIIFSDVLEADYYNKKLTVMSLIKINKGSLEKGTYKVKIYVNRIFTQEATIKLK